MNLSEQKVIGVNQIHILNSLNMSLLKISIKRKNEVGIDSDDLIIYVDKNNQNSPSDHRKQYIFNLNNSLKYFNQVSDEFLMEVKIKNNDLYFETYVKRLVSLNENEYLLEEEIEVLDSFPLTLFEGENYIYTNYSDVDIEVIYPIDNELNRTYLNNAIYLNKKYPYDFSLDDIYFKDAFTKIDNKLNLEINSLDIECLTSKNNKFSLDMDGNLVVNSIAIRENPNDKENICDLIYPIGSIYLFICK